MIRIISIRLKEGKRGKYILLELKDENSVASEPFTYLPLLACFTRPKKELPQRPRPLLAKEPLISTSPE